MPVRDWSAGCLCAGSHRPTVPDSGLPRASPRARMFWRAGTDSMHPLLQVQWRGSAALQSTKRQTDAWCRILRAGLPAGSNRSPPPGTRRIVLSRPKHGAISTKALPYPQTENNFYTIQCYNLIK
uniref:Uncharacterized protein n=1 Tax=Spironucleus salmonicida TaxID=348837 RepID=V6LRY3_9EUKA|eukprot:EST47417.1 Hypothetical protein SS50377_12402 [Spironucleus salmonicida]